MTDLLYCSMDTADYKHVLLGPIFLKYFSDAFEERRKAVLTDWRADAVHDGDERLCENLFWVPVEARWPQLRAQARRATVGLSVDQAIAALERGNALLKGVVPRDYARPAVDKRRFGRRTDLVSNIQIGAADARSSDVGGRVYV